MDIRVAQKADLKQLLELYTQLHNNARPALDADLENLWHDILSDKNHYIIIGLIDGAMVSSCVLTVVPNLTQNQRPYGLVENVITHESHRKKGYASLILNFARDIARSKNCYKIMLLTGSRQECTFAFYEKAGYNQKDKTAFIQWLDCIE